MEILAEGVAESSADQPSQTIYQTLNHSRNDFWSSKGSASNQTHESLIYRLLDHACIVKQVIIQPFKAFFQHGLPCYAPQYVTVSVGFRQDQYHFTSPPFPVVNTPTEQTIDLAPLMIVGGFLKMDLYGRNTTQPGDNLYYTVLDRVKCLGLPITTFFNNSENISNALPTLASSLLKLGDVLNADYPTHYFKFPMKEYLEVSGDSSDKKREEILHTALVKSFHSDYFYENYNPDNYSRPICKLKKVLKRCLGRQEWPEIMRLISLESQKSPFRQAEFLEPLFERYNCNLASRNEPCNAMGIHSLNLYLNRGDADNQAVNDGLPFFLNNSEAMLFARTVLRDHKRIPESLAMFTGAMESRWFDCTEAIGEVFRSEVRDLVLDSLCLEIYGLANCFDKVGKIWIG